MENYKEFIKTIQSANNILITTHDFPDADGIGSQVALSIALQQLGKNVLCINEEALLDRYEYLAPNKLIKSLDNFSKNFKDFNIDLMIVVDTNNPSRIGSKMQGLIERSEKIFFIDHHPVLTDCKRNQIVNTKAAATGQIVGEIIENMNISFTKEMALALYTAVLIDTSSFRYPTVTGDTHRLIAKCIDAGINPPEAYNRVYGTKKIPHMQLLGHILASAQNNKNEEIAWITVKDSQRKAHEVDIEDTHSFINYLLVLENVKIACMFRDVGDEVKISFRSAGGVDVGAIAQKLGGGGHNHSAATVVTGELDSVVKDIVSKIERILKEI